MKSIGVKSVGVKVVGGTGGGTGWWDGMRNENEDPPSRLWWEIVVAIAWRTKLKGSALRRPSNMENYKTSKTRSYYNSA